MDKTSMKIKKLSPHTLINWKENKSKMRIKQLMSVHIGFKGDKIIKSRSRKYPGLTRIWISISRAYGNRKISHTMSTIVHGKVLTFLSELKIPVFIMLS